MWPCNYGSCGGRGTIVETTWRINASDVSQTWTICTECAPISQEVDRQFEERGLVVGHLYLPIVQPVMGSEQALAMEAALFAVGRLLLLTPEDRALLQAAQDAAWERVQRAQVVELLRWYVWDQACQARNHVHADGYWYGYWLECLEAAQRVEDGEWP